MEEGSEKTRLRKIIDTHRAQDYIRLLGHVKLDEIYNDYELFLSASTSEGFGLTLMEAVGSGLGMIGLNVNYGNPTFIRDGEMATWYLLIPTKIVWMMLSQN